eukprot:m.260083 g.260083  ORF g.260083 m.260083 type:complete len:73 (+) comp40431_c0_seq33:789-1007(+)
MQILDTMTVDQMLHSYQLTNGTGDRNRLQHNNEGFPCTSQECLFVTLCSRDDCAGANGWVSLHGDYVGTEPV